MQSLSILFTGEGQVELQTRDVPAPGPGEILVQATKTQISTGTERICLDRLFEPHSHWDHWVRYPFAPGYSMVGHAIAIGSNVTGIQEGDRVAVRRPHQQYAVVPTNALYPIPDEISDEEAAWFALATITQNGVRRATQQLGEDVVVIGLGPLGQLVTQYARLLGARQVIALDIVDWRLSMARNHGATTTLAMSAQDALQEILRHTHGAGAHLVYDVTGISSVFGAALQLLRRFGRLVLLGDTGAPSEQHLVGDVIRKGLSIIGAHDSTAPSASTDHAYWSQQRMIELFFTYLSRGDMHVSDLNTHCYSPRDAQSAYQKLRKERASTLGVLFDWTQV